MKIYICKCGLEFEHKNHYANHQKKCDVYHDYIQNTLTNEYLYELYIVQEKSLLYIEKETKITKGQIEKKLKEFNIHIRTLKQALNIENVKSKIRETNNKKYGVDYLMGTKQFHINTSILMMEKYDVYHYMQTTECKDKLKKTNNKIY
jgi:hypothetical protein